MAHPASRYRLLNHGRDDLPDDINGVADGYRYQSFLSPENMHAYKSLRSGKEGVWSGRTHYLASLDEHNVFLELEANPYVLAIREGYPLVPPDVIEDLVEGKPVARNRVMTIDFALTLPPKTFGGPLRYLGLHRKPASLAQSAASKRRRTREELALNEMGWTWAPVAVPSQTRIASLWKLREWAKAWPIDRGHRDAVELSALLYKTGSTKDLDRLLRMLGKRLGISASDQYFVLAAAFYFGYVSLAKDAVLDEGLPLMLTTAARRPFGTNSYG